MELNQVTVPCTDYVETVKFYELLGLRLIVDSPPRYARFETSNGATFSIHAEGMQPGSGGCVVYFEVDDVDATVDDLGKRGLNFESKPVDQEWLWREAYINDPSGNRICIYHAGENRLHPPWRVS